MLGLSQTCGYAILALSCLPGPGSSPAQVKEIAERTGIAKPYLAKVIHALGEAGLVDSRRGNKGGIVLARPATEITVLEVLEAVEGKNALNGCLLGRTECTDERACPTHFFWKRMRGEVKTNLAKMTLAEVAEFELVHGVFSRDPVAK